MSETETFWSKVDKSNPDGCWLWNGSINSKYGTGSCSFTIDGKRMSTGSHRVAWLYCKGRLPDASLIRSCANNHCVNPSHYSESEYQTLSVEEFFRAKTKMMPNGCLEWQGVLNKCGYGIMSYTWPSGKRRSSLAHRVAWHLAYGVEPDLCLLHSCDNPKCCLVDHLRIGTRADNVADMVARKRHSAHDKNSGFASWMHGERHHSSRFTNEQAIAIRKEYSTGDVTQRSLAHKYGVSYMTMSRLLNGQSYTTAESEGSIG